MAENVEEIEAKLAAYVDGELTPAERVEIETHLEANPSHRVLLQDLMLHRNMLRSLPREKAPGDCTEGFQGQLERDILLGGNELAQARRRWRIQYSPQLLSAAAIILVAVALGIIVYTVLPPHQSHPPIAQLSTEPAKNTDPVVSETTGTLADSRSYKIAVDEPVAKKGAVDANWNLSKEAVVGQKVENSTLAFQDRSQQQQLAATGDMMVITVTADDVKSANEAVVSYLALNKIRYTAEMDGVWKDGVDALATARRVVTAGAAPGGAGEPALSGGTLAGASLTAITPSQTPAIQLKEDQVAKREETLLRSRAEATQPEARTDLKAATAQIEEKKVQEKVAQVDELQQERFARAARPAPRPEPAAAPTTQPTAIAQSGSGGRGVDETVRGKSAFGGYGGGAGGGGYGGANSTVVMRQQQQQFRSLSLADADAACVVIARDMNGQQVRELARSLSQPERNVYATVQMDRAGTYSRTASVTLGRANTDEFSEQVPANQQRALHEAEVMLKDKAIAGNAPALVGPSTRPATEGLNIKPSEAGLSRGDGENASRAGGTITANISPDFAFKEAGQQLPAQQQANYFGAAATQPVAAAGRLDTFTCVIVVQNNTAKAAGPATTQPIAGKPATTAPTEPAPAAKEAK